MPEPTITNNESNQEPLTAESIAAIIDSRINNFVHSNKTDLAKMKADLTGFKTVLDTFKPNETPIIEPKPEDAKTSVLERQIRELQEANKTAVEKAARADKDSALNKALSTFNFASEIARDTAYKVFSQDMKDLGDGTYAIGDQPLNDAVKARMADLSGLIAPKNVGGSGATSQQNQPTNTHLFRTGMNRQEQQALAHTLAKEL